MRKMTKFERGIVKAMRARGAEVKVLPVETNDDCIVIQGEIFAHTRNEGRVYVSYLTVVEVGVVSGNRFEWVETAICDDALEVYTHTKYWPTWAQVHNAIHTL